MKREKLTKLVKEIEAEIKKAQTFAKNTKKAAQEIAKSAAASPSQSGDREHSKNQAEIAGDYLAEVKEIQKGILSEIQKEIPLKVENYCFVKIAFDDGRTEEYYFLETPTKLDGIKFISAASPLGQAIVNLKEEEEFNITEPKIRGKILEIG